MVRAESRLIWDNDVKQGNDKNAAAGEEYSAEVSKVVNKRMSTGSLLINLA